MHNPPKPSEKFESHAELIKDEFFVYWKIYDKKLVIEVHAKTKGWLCFGFSPHSGVQRADVFIGWIENGLIHFSVISIGFCLIYLSQFQCCFSSKGWSYS
jgi:hypothetical protein